MKVHLKNILELAIFLIIISIFSITTIKALEISNASVDYVNLTDYGGNEINIVNSTYKTITTGNMHFALKYHAYVNYTTEEIPYTAILVICANNTPIRTGANNYTDIQANTAQTMTAGASCLLDNQTTGTLYYLPLGKKTIAPNSMCTAPCNHFNDWSYTITANSKIKYSSLMLFNEEDYLIFKNNVATIDKIDQEAQAIIDTQNQNTTDIIDSLGNLGQDIVNNANQNTQNIIDSQIVCQIIDKNSIKENKKQLLNTGQTITNENTGVTDYIKIIGKTIKEINVNGNEGYLNRFCFYDVNKDYVNCEDNAIINEITIPTNAYYFRSTIVKASNKPTYKICGNGNQEIQDTLNQEHTYNNNASENIDGQTDLDNMKNREEQILNNLDFSGAEDLNITIDANTSSYIWQIVEQLRGMNGKIVLLFTSILGLGIIKLILNR